VERLDDYVRGFRERAEQERQRVKDAREAARAAAVRAVDAVVTTLHPRRVLLIGSLPRGTFRPGSDLDLAVEGIPADQVVDAEAVASAAAGLRVDVLRLEGMDPGWRAHHERFGEVAFARR
jgi:predicted nucleotidyltransferase